MEQLPKFVSVRMRNLQVGAHPDPNLLTAFAEGALREDDRARVLDHLSRCGDCREVVWLTQPEAAAGQTVLAPRRATWFPALRWAAVACVLVIAVAVGFRYNQRTAKENLTATVAPPVQPAATPIAQPKETAPAPEPNLNAKLDVPSRPEIAPKAEAKKLRSAESTDSISNAPSLASRDNEQMQAAGALAAAPPAAAPNPDVSESANVSSEPSQLADARETARAAQSVLGKAKAPVGSEMSAKVASANSLVKTEAASVSGASIPRWTLSSDGTLQRSLDSGQTWQAVPLPTTAVMRALTASGPEIWVGGASGALYHSTDAGSHWMPIRPAASGRELTADIIGVEFTDPQHGKITTSDQHVWTTADGGQSWDFR